MLRGIGTNTLRQRDRHRAVIFERDEVMVAKEASVHADDFLKGFAGTRPESGLWSVIKVPRWHYSAGVTVRSRTRALPPRPRQQERGIPVETYVGSRSSCFREPDCPGGDCLMPDGQTAGSHHFPTTTPSSPPQRAQRPNSCTACDNSAISDEVAEALRQFIEALSTSPRRTHDPDALLTAEELAARGHRVRADADSARLFRSVLMKPEHEDWIPRAHAQLERLVAQSSNSNRSPSTHRS